MATALATTALAIGPVAGAGAATDGASTPAARAPRPATSVNPLPACGIAYRVLGYGPTTLVAEVTFTNVTAVTTSAWSVGFTLPQRHRLVTLWSGEFSEAGRALAVKNASWNGVLAPGQSTSFGFVSEYSGALEAPDGWSVNGAPCRGGTTPPTTTTTTTRTTTTPGGGTTTTEPTPSDTTTTTTPGGGTTTTEPTPSDTTTPGGETPRVDNPYLGARGYVNPEWSAKAAAEPGGDAVAQQSTAIWLDRIAAIDGVPDQESYGAMGVRDHLEEALRQQEASGGEPVVVQFVLHDLPMRNCTWLSDDGELGPYDLGRYKSEYVDAIAEIQSDPRYGSLRIVNLIEPHALATMVTSLGYGRCGIARDTAAYLEGVRYAVATLGEAGNTYQYVDAGHHAMLGWENNLRQGARVISSAVNEVSTGFDGVAGVIVNLGDYAATQEPFLDPSESVSGTPQRASRWLDWNQFADEATYAAAMRAELINQGFPEDIGVLIDTSRNGWGGSSRPTAASSSKDLNTFVDESRLDRRHSAANWCNQAGAGLGERPTAAPLPGVDAFIWGKPPGESDGSSVEIDNDEGRVFTRECDPTYTGMTDGSYPTGALSGAPIAGSWFSAQFQQLLENAWPPVE